MDKKTKTPTAMTIQRNNAPMPYFSLARNVEEKTADIYIFGNIAHNRGGLSGLLQSSSDQSSYDLANQIAGIPEDYAITVHINSNGGELKEGLGIYNVLKSRNVTTICEGFAASAGSVIFCAGRIRIMQPASLLFIHQASMAANGNADDFEKASDDLRVITSAAVEAYKESGIVVNDDELMAMLRAETWITPEEAVAYGFATQIAEPEQDEDGIVRNDAMQSIMAAVKRESGTEPVMVPVSMLEVLEEFSAAIDRFGGLFNLAEKVETAIGRDPELFGKLKAAVDMLLATEPAPRTQEQAEHKGFFNL